MKALDGDLQTVKRAQAVRIFLRPDTQIAQDLRGNPPGAGLDSREIDLVHHHHLPPRLNQPPRAGRTGRTAAYN